MNLGQKIVAIAGAVSDKKAAGWKFVAGMDKGATYDNNPAPRTNIWRFLGNW